MAETIWKIDRRSHLLLEKDVAKLTVHLKKLDEDHLRFVILAYDYESPYKRFPEKDRIRKAKRIVWKRDESENFFPEKTIEDAIQEYRDFQYDNRRELIEAYKTKITMLQQSLLEVDKPGQIAKYDDDISILMKRMRSLQDEISKDEETNTDPKNRRSMIEIWQMNQVKAKNDREAIAKKKRDNELLAEN